MSKILIVLGLIMMSVGFTRIAHAAEVLVTKEDITIEAGITNTFVPLGKDTQDILCSLKHEVQSETLIIAKHSGLAILSSQQSNLNITLRNGAVSKYKFLTNLNLESLSTGKLLVLSCKTVQSLSANDILSVFVNDFTFNLLKIDEVEKTSFQLIETSAENSF